MKLALSLLLGCTPLLASAEIYRWIDATGQVHFTQTPPATGSYRNVTPTGVGPSNSPAAHTGNIESSDGKPRQLVLKTKADNAERCAKARERIDFLEEKTAHRLFRTGDDGQPVRLTEEEFEQELNDAKAAAAKYCE